MSQSISYCGGEKEQLCSVCGKKPVYSCNECFDCFHDYYDDDDDYDDDYDD